jgi:2-amino-4-hydroxy-6-hydroxymethyldihydropteridine diphosphokinase
VDRIAYIGVGSNIEAYRNCIEGIGRLTEDGRLGLLCLSSLYRTSPVSPVAQDDFLNCVCKVTWGGEAMDLLEFLESVEQQMGRVRDVPMGPRTLDLDILLFDGLVIDTIRLTIPHPRLHERKFVLVPCLEIDRNLVHPVLNRPFFDILAAIGDDQRIDVFKTVTRDEILEKRSTFRLLSALGCAR